LQLRRRVFHGHADDGSQRQGHQHPGPEDRRRMAGDWRPAMKPGKFALASLAVAIAIGITGCTTEYEISEDEAARMLSSDRPFEVDGKPFSGRVIYREGDQVNFTAELEDGRPHGVLESF